MMRRPPHARFFLTAIAVASLALLGAGCGGDDGGGAAPAEPGTVAVRDNVFVPKTVEISAGDTVTWNWEGSALHNVVGDGFQSETQKSGDFEHTFDDPGTYDYVCTLHPGMTGKVEVSE
jgi:plastocyanin